MAKTKRRIEVVPYNPEWKQVFNELHAMIESYIGDLILKIEHVGSTSVEGLAAKPIIDIDVVMESYEVFPEIVARLAQYGFEHEGDFGVEGREAFRRNHDDGLMRYYLYVCPQEGKGYLEHIAFRDYLRSHPQARDSYSQLKYQLAEKYRHDIDSYSREKTAFVQEILLKTLYATRS